MIHLNQTGTQLQNSRAEYDLLSLPTAKSINAVLEAKLAKKVFDWHTKTILIAEDEEFNFLYLREILGPTKAVILRAMDGEMAVQICMSSSVDLVLMDIKMPRMNGLDATKNIRSFNLKIPVIAQTAFALIEDSEKCFAAGCTDYLTKPISNDLLLSIIDKYLEQ
jgi:CheY-like chemotaxis protein